MIEQYPKKILQYFKHFKELSLVLSTFFFTIPRLLRSVIPSLLVTLLIPLSRSQHHEYPKTYSKSKQTILSYSRYRYFRPRTAIHFARQIHQSRGKNFLLSHHFSFFGVVPPSLEARLLLNKLVCLSRGSFNFNRLVNRYETFVCAPGDRLRDSLEEIAKYAN